MPRQHNIRWSQTDNEQLKKAVRNAKDKARRLSRSGQNIALPEIPTYSQLKSGINTRSEFNKTINQLKSFSKRGGETKLNTNINRLSDNHQQRELNRTVQLFNNKVDELNQRYAGQNIVIPEKINVSDLGYLKKSSDLNAEIKSLTGFLKKGSEELVDVPGTQNNIKVTKWQLDYMEQKKDAVNEKRAERLAEFETRVKEQNVDPGKRSAEATGYRPTKIFNQYSTKEDIQKKMRQLRKEGRSDYWNWRDELSKQNYIDRLRDEYGTGNQYANEIIKRLEGMDTEEWKDIFREEPEEFDLLYGKDRQGKLQHLAKLYNMWMPDNEVTKSKKDFLNEAFVAYSTDGQFQGTSKERKSKQGKLNRLIKRI